MKFVRIASREHRTAVELAELAMWEQEEVVSQAERAEAEQLVADVLGCSDQERLDALVARLDEAVATPDCAAVRLFPEHAGRRAIESEEAA
ncbi:hypothetical protein EV191_12833 [Tamaricihabitans halophyticus]|uniref:Uncharacterized protein n=1 Tax=Tamaricihabitans halophyticus TaxID=1262583 RepID=A0A4R2PX80_9PSEU|nr:hypothetical protein [Tamaricihabitans halophyticus]TCP40783.1 hypothetical protein EV191_12833 [Tamaricihabitans halophyticus]